MGVYIRGMEMPEDGSCIQIVIDDDGKVYPSVEKCILKMGSIAKAVPVPKHVDLIDRNKLIQSVSAETCDCNPDHFDLDDKDGYGEWMLHNGINTGIVAASVRIKAAPAIIPEDEVV